MNATPVSLHAVEPLLAAEEAVSAIHDYAALKFHQGSLYGVGFDAASGRNRLCHFSGGQAESLLPNHVSVRSRVHEYGGGAWCIAGFHACFVHADDQQIWQAPLAAGEPPHPLTCQPDTRFADLTFDPLRERLLAISETHLSSLEPVNRLAAISLHTGAIEILAEGADFYSSPTLSPDGCQLAWIEWDHPQQPWRCTRVMLAQLNEQGEVETARQVSDADEAAWAQPRFAPDGTLHVVVDRNNWWRIESLTATGFQALSGTVPERTEFTTAPWQFGLATYGWNAAGALLALGQCEGYTYLWCHDGAAWRPLELSLMPARMHALVCDGDRLGCVAEFSDRLPAVVRIDSALTADDPDQCDILYGGDCPAYTPSLPVSLSVERDENLSVPYFLYRPAGIPADRLLPLVIWTHGGPTAMTAPSFKPAIQYWTQRGFMIADVNYRGSTGYGRDYRMQLEGQWGIRDVDDVIAVAADLVEQGQADPQALFIRGNSAGGYTTLSALCDSDLFSGGASLYGVSDPARLNQLTHKFESRYLHWLIGDPQQQSKRYLERSPLHRADRISAPVIFFQGMQDQVVLPEQTRNMAESLNCNDIRVETHYFDNEAHGFRQPDNQAAVLEHELAFYRSIIS